LKRTNTVKTSDCIQLLGGDGWAPGGRAPSNETTRIKKSTERLRTGVTKGEKKRK